MKDIKEIEEFDKLKTKVLKYVLYKKRTEAEVRQKFSENAGNNLENVIEYLKEQNYINDNQYIEKSINEYIVLKNLSLKEIEYKLFSKGVNKNILENYISNNKDKLLEYEIKSAKNILAKKIKIMEREEILNYLIKKGYKKDTIKQIIYDN